MYKLDRWQQTPNFDPSNPGQMIQEHYTGLPGGYSSFYYNKVPTEATLQGVLANATDKGVRAGMFLGAMVILGGLFWAAAHAKEHKHSKKTAY